MAKRIRVSSWMLGGLLTIGAGIASADDAKPAPLPTGQVWECEIAGQRVFSDAKCGTHASIRQLHELNVMDRAARSVSSRSYSTGDYPQPEMDASPETSDEIYATQQVVVGRERLKREHLARHGSHAHGRP